MLSIVYSCIDFLFIFIFFSYCEMFKYQYGILLNELLKVISHMYWEPRRCMNTEGLKIDPWRPYWTVQVINFSSCELCGSVVPRVALSPHSLTLGSPDVCKGFFWVLLPPLKKAPVDDNLAHVHGAQFSSPCVTLTEQCNDLLKC